MEDLQVGEGRNVVCNVLGHNNSRGLAREKHYEGSERETTPTLRDITNIAKTYCLRISSHIHVQLVMKIWRSQAIHLKSHHCRRMGGGGALHSKQASCQSNLYTYYEYLLTLTNSYRILCFIVLIHFSIHNLFSLK